jgi:hypothetical protein
VATTSPGRRRTGPSLDPAGGPPGICQAKVSPRWESVRWTWLAAAPAGHGAAAINHVQWSSGGRIDGALAAPESTPTRCTASRRAQSGPDLDRSRGRIVEANVPARLTGPGPHGPEEAGQTGGRGNMVLSGEAVDVLLLRHYAASACETPG